MGWMLEAVAVVALLGTALPPAWALLHLLVAVLNAVMWFVSARAVWQTPIPALPQVKQNSSRLIVRQGRFLPSLRLPVTSTRALLPTIAPFRALAVLLVAILFQNYAGQVQLPNLAGLPATIALWLMVQGLLTVALTEEPLKGGIGLLTALAGFKLAYVAQEPTAGTLLLLNLVELLIGFAVAYLIVARALPAKANVPLGDQDLEP